MTTTAEVRAAQVDDPGFGRYFTDHMAMARWDRSRGWHDVEVVPRQDLVMHPSAMVLHYGQAVFEGLKACVQGDGGVALFRPSASAARFSRSAARLAMPELPIALFLATCEDLVRADREWVPARPEHSLYLRPVMIASEPSLGVRPANEFLYFVIASPTAGFFPGGVRPISVWVADDYVRAAPHGLGSAKCPSNYAASLLGKKEAVARGCDEVVWLDAVERRWVEEMSGMNVFVVLGEAGGHRVLVTPAAGDTILDGITRSSLIELARHLGYAVREEPIGIDEWCEGARSGAVVEAFACGTAAVVAPIGHLRSARGEWTVGNGQPGPVTLELRDALVSIQEGRAPDLFGWLHRV